MKDDKKGQSHSSVGDVRDWCLHQLESAIKKLTERIGVIAYTRNPEALAAAARQCDDLEAVLIACEFQIEQYGEGEQGYGKALSSLLLIEAHQMLAHARSLVHVPLKPEYRSDNVVVLKPGYRDLTDAAFERMLASSDIPQFLSVPAHWDDELPEAPPLKTRGKPQLTLVKPGGQH